MSGPDHGRRLKARPDCTAETCWCEVLRFHAAVESTKLKRRRHPVSSEGSPKRGIA